jgi:predicted dehydrogenase
MYSVGIIGLGNIAAFYSTPEATAPYCHVGGIRQSDRVRLAAVADMDPERRARFAEVWGQAFPEVRYYDSGRAMLEAEELDIVAVCNRGPAHHVTVLEVLHASPKAVFLEKPLSCSLVEMDEMFVAAADKRIPITVSYSRHWAPRVLRMQQLVESGIIGAVETVIGYTGKAVLSFAGHETDLICQFAGYDVEAVYARGTIPTQTVPDGYEVEPHLDGAIMEFRSGLRACHVGRNGEHGPFYVEVLGTTGRLRTGMYTPPVVVDLEGRPRDTSTLSLPPQDSPFRHAYEQIAAQLAGGPSADCTGADARAVHEAGFAAIESIHTGTRVELPVKDRGRRVFANG